MVARRFKAVHDAYEVLSDPHERAWYDRNRDQIIGAHSGASTDKAEADADPVFALFTFFSPSVFSGLSLVPAHTMRILEFSM
jgi:DnaJ family protein A protein 5